MKVHIIEFDNDYRSVSGFFTKEFSDLKEAEEWCKKESWSGHRYYIDERIHS